MDQSGTFRRTVTYDPYGSQQKFHELESKYKGFSGPVGSGKSFAFVNEALKLAYINNGCQGLIGAPTYPMLRDVTQTAFFEMLFDNNVPHVFRKSENVVYLPEPGSEILFRTMDQPERLRGMNLAWFGVDELTYCKKEAWERLEARLRSPKAKRYTGFAVWTPKGFDWVYRRFVANERPPAYQAIFAKPGENHHLPKDFYETLRKSYDERFFKQEVLGEYLPQFGGQVYFNFDRNEHVTKLDFDPRYELCWALDFNIDPASSVICQIIDTTTRAEALVGRKSCRLNVIDEISLPDARTIQHCEALKKRLQPFLSEGLKAINIYGDASGGNRHSSSLKSDWQQVKEFLKRETNLHTNYRVPTANPGVRDRVIAVTSLLRDAAGEIKLYVDPRCSQLIQDFEEVAWKRDNNGNALDEIDKSDPKRTHTSDALGYLVYREAPILERGGPRSTVII